MKGGARLLLSLCLILGVLLSACSYTTGCSLVGIPSVIVEVYDYQGQPAALGATATLTDEAGQTSSETGVGDDAAIDISFDNRGNPFALEVTRPYHQSVTVENLSTPEGFCGITNPAQASVVLTLEPDAPPVRQVVVGGPVGYGACIEEHLHASVVAAPGVSREVTWESSDPAVVSVTPGGFLRAGCGRAGHASLTARSVVDLTRYAVLEVEASGTVL